MGDFYPQPHEILPTIELVKWTVYLTLQFIDGTSLNPGVRFYWSLPSSYHVLYVHTRRCCRYGSPIIGLVPLTVWYLRTSASGSKIARYD